ncbi:MAG: phosphoribosyl-ATP diphosphatase [Clostridiales bacterium]|nr:MAG: phosphoribosyl-ATP diphosphatase [Clostridiales bacterium]
MNDNVLTELYSVIISRKQEPQEGSYTCYLFDKGLDKILKKIGEESAETIIAAKNDCKEDLVGEIADLIFHIEVMCAEKGVDIQDVLCELDCRSKKIGNLKNMRNTDKNT